MQLSPRYESAPLLVFVDVADPSGPLRRQRERLLSLLRSLDDAQWDAPSRCEKWSVKDVVSHLVGVDRFWDLSFAAGTRGEPTTYLTNFDPVATPEQMVDGMRALSPRDVLAQFEAATLRFLATADGVTDWSLLAEAPPGHVPLCATAMHALWDAWIHERDIVIPLGLEPVADDEEIALALQYAAALSPALAVASGDGGQGALTVAATAPDVVFTVEIGDRVVVRDGDGAGARLTGGAVELAEALSHRAATPSLAPDDQWMLAGLSAAFDVA